jgi:hypothetical protein
MEMTTYEPLNLGPHWFQSAVRGAVALAVAGAFAGAFATAGPGNWAPLAKASDVTLPPVIVVAKRDVAAADDAVRCAQAWGTPAGDAPGRPGNLQQ